jgi:hypothetical protein
VGPGEPAHRAALTRSATACAAIPSPRPTKPIPSPVVAFTFTWAGRVPSASASRARISSPRGAIRGRRAASVTSQLPTRQPASPAFRAISRRSTSEETPFQRGSVSGK